MRYFINTYGCQMNYSDTERIESYLNQLGFTKVAKEPDADLIIFNSCSIRQKAEDRVLGKMENLAKTKRARPDLLLALTGCMVRKSSTKNTPRENQDKFVKRLKPLDIAFRIEDLPKLESLIKEVAPTASTALVALPTSPTPPGLQDHKIAKKPRKSPGIFRPEPLALADYFHITPHRTSTVQAFIPISTGCDKFCTYCIVPYARGREVSRPLEDIMQEARDLVDQGCLEITLIGQTVDSYGLSPIDRQNRLFDYTRIDAGTYI